MNKGLKVFLWIVGIGILAYIGYKIYKANQKPVVGEAGSNNNIPNGSEFDPTKSIDATRGRG